MKVKQLIFFNIKIHSIEQEMNWDFWKIIHIHTHSVQIVFGFKK